MTCKDYQASRFITAVLMLASAIASGLSASSLHAQAAQAPAVKKVSAGAPMHYHPNRVPKREQQFFGVVWGVDSLSVKAVESGELIRFSYRILNPAKATILNDKKVEADLISPAARAKLVIPSLEKVGQLRQASTPEAGRSYWMAFSNPRRLVKRGDHVNIDIGSFHALDLVVE